MKIDPSELGAPLRFRPEYQRLIWGGQRLAQWRPDMPAGPIGESWELADHDRGVSVVANGPLAGHTLRELVEHAGVALVGPGFGGGRFPLMVKILDVHDRLSVQVHPDDALARLLGVGDNGKTECWVILEDGGSVFQGTRPGVDRTVFETALRDGAVVSTLNRFDCRAGDVFFLPARTVHAVGDGCLLYEIQQTSDVTFRVDDWGRVGLDGRTRPLHLAESMVTIDFACSDFGPFRPACTEAPHGVGAVRQLADCPYFLMEEVRLPASTVLERSCCEACTIITCVKGEGEIETKAGRCTIASLQTVLVSSSANAWCAVARSSGLTLLSATPKL